MGFKRGVVLEVTPEDRDWFRDFSVRLAIRQPEIRNRKGWVSSPAAFAELVRIAKEWEREHA